MCCEQTKTTTTCPYCEYQSCVPCQRRCVVWRGRAKQAEHSRVPYRRYLTSIVTDPHCMACKRHWDRMTQFRVLPRTLVLGALKTHRENVLFEREQGLMPQTQPDVVFYRVQREVQALTREYISNAKTEAALLGLKRCKRPREVDALEDFWEKFQRTHYVRKDQKPKKAELIRKCPGFECKGFLNKAWKCELCTETTCERCNEIVTPGHECDPQTVETVRLIRKDTKPCPTCGTLIYRASGCPQMWCVECHTTFDWNTGALETGVRSFVASNKTSRGL